MSEFYRYRKKIRASLLVLALIVVWPGFSVAVEGDQIYSVYHVDVDVTARTSAQARERALMDGQRKALNVLFARLLLENDLAGLPPLDDANVRALVNSIEFEQEGASSVRYLASLNIHFREERIRRLLEITGIPFSETLANRTLVIPLFAMGGTLSLWTYPNPWLEAWQRHDSSNSLLEFITPPGHQEDFLLLTPREVRQGAFSDFEEILDRYQARDVLIVFGRMEGAAESGRATLKVEVREISANMSQTTSFVFSIDAGEIQEGFLDRAANELVGHFEESWKQRTLLQFGQDDQLEVRVPLTGLEEWLKLKDHLDRIAMIRKTEILSLTHKEARITFVYLGNLPQLRLALNQAGISLVQEQDQWRLSFREGEQNRERANVR